MTTEHRKQYQRDYEREYARSGRRSEVAKRYYEKHRDEILKRAQIAKKLS